MTDDWRDTNRALWDERVPIHVAGDFYDLEGFIAGRSELRPFERDELGDVSGATLLHPQCHIGTDTLSWAREGATVTGLDFSGPAVEAATELAKRAGLEQARFIQGDVYDAPQLVDNERFDVVYTGLCAINWLPDIDRWAQTMAQLVKPEGRFYLVEFHPFSSVFGDDDLTVAYPYFQEEPFEWDEPGTYADLEAPTQHNRSVEWNHGLGEVVSALIKAGLTIEFLHEHNYTLFPRWSFLENPEHGIYRLPENVPSLPLMYSLLARPK
jgi:SAM-dependent methyltransferase